MRLKLFVVLVACALSAPVVTEAQTTLFEGERELVRMPRQMYIDSIFANQMCGDYFIFGRGEDQPDGITRIAYFLKSRRSDPENILLAGAFALDKFQTVIDERRRVPTMTLIVGDGDRIPTRIIVRISSRDYRRSPCLPRPSSGGIRV